MTAKKTTAERSKNNRIDFDFDKFEQCVMEIYFYLTIMREDIMNVW